eukprot:CAMPEP_0116040668 /NCGR_PEP_ID=MMETSP0321-20121206/24511_1 /TAXON_ID=163516 /ORGANISM="Leptocylindrus danicus var. danicus, Strain B650" /LENGTH=120 /DNA_ID=CAMNT_0003520557 /DNA_START=184 /DNA_END=543 /DNA_ORIENTATION=+
MGRPKKRKQVDTTTAANEAPTIDIKPASTTTNQEPAQINNIKNEAPPAKDNNPIDDDSALLQNLYGTDDTPNNRNRNPTLNTIANTNDTILSEDSNNNNNADEEDVVVSILDLTSDNSSE